MGNATYYGFNLSERCSLSLWSWALTSAQHSWQIPAVCHTAHIRFLSRLAWVSDPVWRRIALQHALLTKSAWPTHVVNVEIVLLCLSNSEASPVPNTEVWLAPSKSILGFFFFWEPLAWVCWNLEKMSIFKTERLLQLMHWRKQLCWNPGPSVLTNRWWQDTADPFPLHLVVSQSTLRKVYRGCTLFYSQVVPGIMRMKDTAFLAPVDNSSDLIILPTQDSYRPHSV